MSRVLLLYNKPLLPLDHPDADSEHTIVDVAKIIHRILKGAGHEVRRFGLGQDPSTLWRLLTRQRPDVIVNLFEGNLGNTETEAYVAGLLEWSGVPFTGSPMRALSLCRGKDLAKQLLRGAGLPTADFFVVEELPLTECPLEFPVFVKLACQDASVGIAHSSVCTDLAQLVERVSYLLENYGPPVMVEEYISGREINVALVELPQLQNLPPSEILFPPPTPGVWPILTYDGKWKPGHPDFDTTPPKFPADLSPRMARRLADLAKEAFRLMGCRDYARVDFRLRGNRPYILEVNPNPDINEEAGFAGCLASGGWKYADFVLRLVEQARDRQPGPAPTLLLNHGQDVARAAP